MMNESWEKAPEADRIDWPERLVKTGTGIRLKEAYGQGFTRSSIKAAKQYFGILIETRVNGCEMLWFLRGV